MKNQRSSGMIVLGVVNVIIGGYGAFVSAMLVLLCGYLAFAGGISAGVSEEGRRWAAAGRLGLAIAIPAGVANAMLMIGGIGIMAGASWSRTLTLYASAIITTMSILAMLFIGEVSPGAALFAVYGALIVYLCTTAVEGGADARPKCHDALRIAVGHLAPGVRLRDDRERASVAPS